MSKQAFVESMGRRLALVDPAEELRQMFKAFDRRCRGFITRDDLSQVCAREGSCNYCTVRTEKGASVGTSSPFLQLLLVAGF